MREIRKLSIYCLVVPRRRAHHGGADPVGSRCLLDLFRPTAECMSALLSLGVVAYLGNVTIV